jgi:hypothetical protein
MSVKKLLALSVFCLFCMAGLLCYAQYDIEPEAPRSRIHRVRIINDTGYSICLKLVGYGQSRYFHTDLGKGQSTVQDFYSGIRALCIWNDNNGQLLVLNTVNINRGGKLRLRVILYAPKRAEGEQPEAPAKEPAMLEIESDN